MYYSGKLFRVQSPTIGTTHAGGKIAYILTSSDPGFEAGKVKGLIVSSANLAVNYWSNIISVDLPGTSPDFGTGMANSLLIIAQSGHTSSAAKYCRDYRGGGFSDWYLPSVKEMEKIYPNWAILNMVDIPGYWVSTQYSSLLGGYYDQMYLNTGGPKESLVPIRAIRSFIF